MSQLTDSLPDLQPTMVAIQTAQNGLSTFKGLFDKLKGGSGGSVLNDVTGAFDQLGDGKLDIDVSGLTEALPQAIQTIENALPADALKYVEALHNSYQEVVDFLDNSPLLHQINLDQGLETTALAVLDEIQLSFMGQFENLGIKLIDSQDLEKVKAALDLLADLEKIASGGTIPASDLLDFLSQNLVGLAPDLLAAAQNARASGMSVLDPFSEAYLESQLGNVLDSLSQKFQDLAGLIANFDPADPNAYPALPTSIQTIQGAIEASFSVSESVEKSLMVVVNSSSWDTLFSGYATVLEAIPLANAPTIDDAIDAIAGSLEGLLSQLTMNLSPDDLVAQVTGASGSLHDLFAKSPLAQVQAILAGFIEKIRQAIEAVPTEKVKQAVLDMLARVKQEIDDLNIGQIASSINEGFQAANQFVDDRLGTAAINSLSATMDSIPVKFESIPIQEIGEKLAAAVNDANQVMIGLAATILTGLEDIKTLLAKLDGIDFKPVADVVIDDIDALKSKLAAIHPEALSDLERISLQLGLVALGQIDLESMIKDTLKKGFVELEDPLTKLVQAALDLWLDFRRRIDDLKLDTLAAPVTALLNQVDQDLMAINGTLVVSPLNTLVDEMTQKLKTLDPASLLDPLQAPYDKMKNAIDRLNPDNLFTLLGNLHNTIKDKIDRIDLRPLLTTLDTREAAYFSQARAAVTEALDGLALPPPLDTFFEERIKPLVEALTGAVLGDPQQALVQAKFVLPTELKPSSLFQPLDVAFDRLLAMIDSLPSDQLLSALETLRTGIGAALPAMNPSNMMASMRAAQVRIDQWRPSSFPGIASLATLAADLQVKFEATPENQGLKDAVMVQFQAVLAPLDYDLPSSRLRLVDAEYQNLVDALRRRINGLDASGAQAAFQRMEAGLARLLPDFLQQPLELDLAAVNAGLASLRPSTKALRIDAATDRFLAELVPLQEALGGAVGGVFQEIRNAAQMIRPSSLHSSLDSVYDALYTKLADLDPVNLKGSVGEIWSSLTEPLAAIDLSVLKTNLTKFYTDLLAKITGLAYTLIAPIKQKIDNVLESLRKSIKVLTKAIGESGKIIEDTVKIWIQALDALVADDLFKRILQLLVNLKVSFDQELDRVANEFDSMLAAIPLAESSAEVAP